MVRGEILNFSSMLFEIPPIGIGQAANDESPEMEDEKYGSVISKSTKKKTNGGQQNGFTIHMALADCKVL